MTPIRWLGAMVCMLAVAHAHAGMGVDVATKVAPAAPATAIEFYNAALDHYFLSTLAPEIDALDSGRTRGWARTGQAFRVYPDPPVGISTSPVCRFYIPLQHGDSHFFSASPAECAAVAAKIGIDPAYSGYIEESPAVFYVTLPDATNGACPAGDVPVYRLWNRRADSNHRYTIDVAIRAAMIARGYLPEGYGPDGVAMCALAPLAVPLVHASGLSPFAAGCDDDVPTGRLYVNAEVEPRIAVDPRDGNHLIGVWQQDRWSDGGARGLVTGVTFDGGRTWARSMAAFSRCTGGTVANGGDFARASDPWISIAPDGTAHQIAIAFTGSIFSAASTNAVLASRSTDGGRTWSDPVALQRDAQGAFNDKESIAADPTDARFVYAVWDRLAQAGGGPAWFARSTDGGQSWEPARIVLPVTTRNQTLNNQIVVLPNGTLVNFFTFFSTDANNRTTTALEVMRSGDRGVTWSAPIVIAPMQALGVADPQTGTPVRDAANLGSIAVGPQGDLVAVWQDARFTAGARDAIAWSRSVDGGLTWSAPVRINAAPNVPAFVPTVHVRDDGTYGVSYYDFRNNTTDPATLPTDFWLTQSSDGVTWRETHVTGPFDLALAPYAEGLFLGDYAGLTSVGATFVPLFAQTNANLANRTDIVAALIGASSTAKRGMQAGHGEIVTRAEAAPALALTPELADRLDRAATRTLQRRWRGTLPRPEAGTPPLR